MPVHKNLPEGPERLAGITSEMHQQYCSDVVAVAVFPTETKKRNLNSNSNLIETEHRNTAAAADAVPALSDAVAAAVEAEESSSLEDCMELHEIFARNIGFGACVVIATRWKVMVVSFAPGGGEGGELVCAG